MNRNSEKPRVKTAMNPSKTQIHWKRPDSEDPRSMKMIKNEIEKSVNFENHLLQSKAKVEHLLDNYKFHSIQEYDSKLYKT